MLKPEDFFGLEGNSFKGIFNNTCYVWDALKNIRVYIKDNIKPNISGLIRQGLLINKTTVIYNKKVIKRGGS